MTNKSERLIDARNGCYGNEESCAGGFTDNREVDWEYPVSMSAVKSVKYPAQQAPTEAERAVDKVLAAHRVQEAAFDLVRARARVLAADRILDRLYVPCPQGDYCLSGQKHERIFACEFCENFKGCSDCVSAHEAEAHWTDSDTAREMHS